MAIILSGKEVATAIRKDTAHQTSALIGQGMQPRLHLVRVGERIDDVSYQKAIEKACAKTGIACTATALPAEAGEAVLHATLDAAAADPAIHGILLFSPLPANYDVTAAAQHIPIMKDVDCINPQSAGAVFIGHEAYPPCTAEAVMALLRFYDADLAGKNATVVGRSLVVGKPLAMLLLNADVTVTIAHSHSQNLPAVCRRADILVAAIGKAKMITKDYIKPGATVIDVGINVEGDKLYGDVDTEAAKEVAGAITPVPGGVGAVTTRVLIKHVIKAAKLQNP